MKTKSSSKSLIQNNKVKVGVIPAAGAGTRLGYLSKLLPKSLFPLYDRPIIHYVVDQMQLLGMRDIYIVVNVFKEKIIEYFKQIEMDLKANIYFIEQKDLHGTAQAILLTEKYIKEPFLVTYGDDCTISDSLEDMIQMFINNDSVVTEVVVKEKNKAIMRQTCSVKLAEDGRMLDIVEKPLNPPYNLRGCGVYLFRPEVYEHIRKTPVHPVIGLEISNTINRLAKLGKAYGYVINGYNVNINNPNELLKASYFVQETKKNKIVILD